MNKLYTLSIRLVPEAFSYLIYNPDNKENCYYQQVVTDSLQSIAANVKTFLLPDIPKEPFEQVNVLIQTNRYTSVPLELFDEEQMETLFYQNFPKKSNEVILCNILGKSNIVVLVGLDKLSHLFLSERFPNARFFASISPEIEYATNFSDPNVNHLYAHIQPDCIEVIAIKDNKLQLINSYPTQNVEDCCYHLLNIWKTIGLNQETDILHLCGRFKHYHPVSQVLTSYIQDIHPEEVYMDIRKYYPYIPSDLPFDIQSLLICE